MTAAVEETGLGQAAGKAATLVRDSVKTVIAASMVGTAIEFYDLKNDPWELNNIATERKHTKRIATMQAALEKWMTEQGDTGAEMDIRKKQ